jgi:regulator of protease activity HflC (stomatin/prohibitin superfamily)
MPVAMTGMIVLTFLLVLIVAGVKAVPQGQIWAVEHFGALIKTACLAGRIVPAMKSYCKGNKTGTAA